MRERGRGRGGVCLLYISAGRCNLVFKHTTARWHIHCTTEKTLEIFPDFADLDLSKTN